MLESAEVGHTVTEEAFDREVAKLRVKLVTEQYELGAHKRGPIVVLVSGVEGGGRGETANTLNEWLDPRHIRTHAFDLRTPLERTEPRAKRYWDALPAKGRIGIFMNAWYRDAIRRHVLKRSGRAEFNAELQEIRQFEEMLSAEGIVLLKFWIHLSKPAQKERLRMLAADPKTRWRVTPEDRQALKFYSKYHDTWEQMLRETSIGQAPWYVVEGTDPKYRMLTIGRILHDAMHRLNVRAKPAPRSTNVPAPSVIGNAALIRNLDLSLRTSEKRYDRELPKYQKRLQDLTRDKRFRERALILAFEGSDAAGKGGAIRRVAGALDARQYVIIPVAAPTEEERAHPYLWRFWRNLPIRGGVTIFDRTWYGRVMVERVEGYCSVPDWIRAYDEINQFEEQLVAAGMVIGKFWLQISKQEQLKRFQAREKTPFKVFKITHEDWRNRKKWDAYEQAVADMLDRTSTEIARWTVVEAEDKYFARVKILRTICQQLERAMD